MRACFLGQNICALGYGVAMLQTPKLTEPAGENPPVNRPSATRSPYPVVIPADGHEYGRPGFYPLAHPLLRPQGSRPL